MASDHQRYHATDSSSIYLRKFREGMGSKNNILLRVAWSACLWDMRRIAIAKSIASVLKRHIEGEEILDVDADLKHKGAGYGENKA